MQPRMWNDEVRLINDLIIKKKNVIGSLSKPVFIAKIAFDRPAFAEAATRRQAQADT